MKFANCQQYKYVERRGGGGGGGGGGADDKFVILLVKQGYGLVSAFSQSNWPYPFFTRRITNIIPFHHKEM